MCLLFNSRPCKPFWTHVCQSDSCKFRHWLDWCKWAYWNLATNWSPAVVPNSTTAIANINQNIAGGTAYIYLDTSVTLNQLNLTSSTTGWTLSPTGAYKITMDGASPSISSTTSPTQNLSVPILFNADTTITNGNGLLNLTGVLTGASKNLTFNTSGIGTLHLSGTSSALTGGTINLVRGKLALDSTSINGAAGPNIIVSNTYSTTLGGGSGAFPNPIQLNDTGTNPFTFNAPFGPTGKITGALTHDLIILPGNSTGLPGDLSSLTFSNGAKIVLGDNSAGQLYEWGGFSSSLSPSVEIDIGSGQATGNDIASVFFNANSAIPNPIKIRPGTVSTGRWAEIATNASSTYSLTDFTGGIVLNSDGNCAAGSNLFTGYYGGVTAFKISGVMSNATTGAANIDFNIGNLLTLSGANTYTSKTYVGLFSPWNNFGLLNLTGSINSTLTTINSSSYLYHSGTINGNVSSLTGGTIVAGSRFFKTRSKS
jgi:hypothetical protein